MKAVSYLREWLLRLLGTVRPRRSDEDLEQELSYHLELAEERLRGEGHSPAEAARLARIEVGKVIPVMETLREQRSFLPLSTLVLDLKLGIRMLRKSWGLTLVGGAAMVLSITLGAGVYEFLRSLGGTDLPLPEGDRMVVLQPWNPATRKEMYSPVEDFTRWRTDLRSVTGVSAFYTVESTIAPMNGPSTSINLAGISAGGLELTRIPPLLGRTLLEQDEAPGAPPVVVLSYQTWRSQFQGDRELVGRQVRLESGVHTVVGIMPEEFVFPIHHDAWTTLTTQPLAGGKRLLGGFYGNPDGAPGLIVFARLAEDSSLQQADAEVKASPLLGNPTALIPAGASPPVEPRAVPYTVGITGNTDEWMLNLMGCVLALLLIPPCTNIAILVFARTVSRQGEFAARSALGASRARIVSQIFIEVLVLALCASAVSVVLAAKLVELMHANIERRLFGHLPFWMDFSLSYQTVLYASGLAVVAAFIAGAIPALRATGRWKIQGLHALGARSAPRLGRVWTGLVVVQVAFSVAFLPLATELAWSNLRGAVLGPGYAAGDFLTARLTYAGAEGATANDTRSAAQRFGDDLSDLMKQLQTEGIRASTVGWVPTESPFFPIEVESVGGNSSVDDELRQPVAVNQVDPAFFSTFGIPLLAGRNFDSSDLDPARRTVIVNRNFAEEFLDGEALGRRIRPEIRDPGDFPMQPWWEVVGVAADRTNDTVANLIYRPLPRNGPASWTAIDAAGIGNSNSHAVMLVMRASALNTRDAAERLRQIASRLDPHLHIDQFRTMQQVHDEHMFGNLLGGSGVVAVMTCLVALSVAGVYTLMAFNVAQRRREIGIRAALGASPSRLTLGIFRSVFVPIGAGTAVGGSFALLVNFYLEPLRRVVLSAPVIPWVLPVTEGALLFVAAIAMIGPIRRALKVNPTEALRNG